MILIVKEIISKGIWIDTKPIIINDIDKSLIIYKKPCVLLVTTNKYNYYKSNTLNNNCLYTNICWFNKKRLIHLSIPSNLQLTKISKRNSHNRSSRDYTDQLCVNNDSLFTQTTAIPRNVGVTSNELTTSNVAGTSNELITRNVDKTSNELVSGNVGKTSNDLVSGSTNLLTSGNLNQLTTGNIPTPYVGDYDVYTIPVNRPGQTRIESTPEAFEAFKNYFLERANNFYVDNLSTADSTFSSNTSHFSSLLEYYTSNRVRPYSWEEVLHFKNISLNNEYKIHRRIDNFYTYFSKKSGHNNEMFDFNQLLEYTRNLSIYNNNYIDYRPLFYMFIGIVTLYLGHIIRMYISKKSNKRENTTHSSSVTYVGA